MKRAHRGLLAASAGLIACSAAIAAPATAWADDAGEWTVADVDTQTSAQRYEYTAPTVSGDVLFTNSDADPIRCWNGEEFLRIPTPSDLGDDNRSVYTLGGVSCSDFYQLGRRNGVPWTWYWDGGSWTGGASGSRYTLDSFEAFAADDMWAFSSIASEGFHYDGTGWRRVTLPPIDVEVTAGTSGDDLWVFGDDDDYDAVAYRWNGTRWTQTPVPASYTGFASQTATASADEVYLFDSVTKSGYLRWDGAVWRHERMTGIPDGYVHGVAHAGDELWVSTYSEFNRLVDGEWSEVPLPEVDNPTGGTVSDMAVDHRTDTVFAGGSSGYPEVGHRDPGIFRYRAATTD
ncbi:hypothetical protein [Streptomyces hainanensis]|uniref:Uncharacterized protein n=1 Tax=Streptomyces hainanensis TaxID=402648 RepID=A0A4R4T501_9ACTN|nr:hypothetical protein [Streptomyces hainanensis]TDC72098.1 hypothetical protein E1283_22715 [Streptomyces hainanensis]